MVPRIWHTSRNTPSISTQARRLAAELHLADDGDTTTLEGTLQAAEGNLAAVGMAPTEAVPRPNSLPTRAIIPVRC
jgi:hypothetical protein